MPIGVGARHHLRRHVRLRADEALQLARHRCVRLDLRRRPKVAQLQAVAAVGQENVRRLDVAMDDAVLVQLLDGGQQLRGKPARQALVQLAGQLDETLERALGAQLHEDQQLLAVHLDAVVLDQIFVRDALEDLQLNGHVLDGARLVRLYGDLLHGHQLAGGVVDGRVHFAEAALADLPGVVASSRWECEVRSK